MATAKVLLGAIVGVAAGFAAGVLTAPKSGKETRTELKVKAEAKKNEAIAKGKDVLNKAGKDAVNKAENVVGQTADKVISATVKAADGVIDTTNELRANSHGAARNTRTALENNK